MAEEHGRPRSEPTFEVVLVPLYPYCLEQTIQIGKDLDPTVSDTIAGHFTLAPDPRIRDTKDMTL